MKSFRFLPCLMVTVIFVTAITPTSLAQTSFFTDTANHWAKDSIDSLKEHCNINGYTDVNGNPLHFFKPDNLITRAELVQMVIQCSFGTLKDSFNQSYFTDIQSQQWFFEAVTKAKQMGWIDGYKDGTFRPNQNINRVEALKIILLTKYVASQMTTGSADFSDVDQNAWYIPYIRFAVSEELVGGYTNADGSPTGTFGPYKSITRAEAAKVIAAMNGWISVQPPSNEPAGTPQPGQTSSGAPKVGNCQIYPSDNPWNRDISNDPVDPNSGNYLTYIKNLGGNQFLHADFGGAGAYGIPYSIVPGTQPKVQIDITWYPDESDAGPYPIPADAKIEGNGEGDAHVIALDKDNCKLYELYAASKVNDNLWEVGGGAIFDLTSNALRPEGWTSADAAGLPIYPGLAKYEEIDTGTMNHALRATFSSTQKAYIHPATHFASSITDSNAPPMGLRLRLKEDFDISTYTGQSLVILETLKKYGLIVADNGSNWYVSGSMDTRWDDEDLNQLKQVPGAAFEVVQSGDIVR